MDQFASTMGGRARRTYRLTRVLASREFRIRYRQSALELLWSLVTPVAMLAVYGVVLTQLFEADGGGVPYLSLVWTGMVAWTTFATALGSGVYSIIGSADMVSKVYFPREVLPLATVGASLVDLAIGVTVLAGLIAVQIRSVSVTALAVLPGVYILLVWTAAMTIGCAVLAVFVRDVTHATRLLLTVGFFATPVMYSSNLLPPGLQRLSELNPLAVVIACWRDALLYQVWPDWTLIGTHAGAGTLACAAAVGYTRSVEGRMVDVI